MAIDTVIAATDEWTARLHELGTARADLATKTEALTAAQAAVTEATAAELAADKAAEDALAKLQYVAKLEQIDVGTYTPTE